MNSKNFLLVPVLDGDGNICSLQFISPIPNTRKNFLTGGRIKGNFLKIEGSNEIVYLVEGYATGWSIYKATGATVYIAFSAGNLLNVAEYLITQNFHKEIIIAADNDTSTEGNPGKTFAEEVAKKYNLPIIWPEFDASQLDFEPSDFNDLHIICGLDAVKSRLDEATPINNESETSNKAKQTKKTQAELLLEITKQLYFFENQEGEILVDLTMGNHKETWPSQSKKFQRWLTAEYLHRYQKTPSKLAINETIYGIEAIALSSRNKHQTHIRIAKEEDCIYLDLCNDNWEVVKIDKQGWKVIKDCPVKFIRTKSMLPLPYPKRNCEITDLWKLIPVKNENDRILILGWLLQLLNPDGPYPLLVLEGPQGSGKSRTTIVLKSLADPSLAMIRTIPSTEKDLFISAKNSLLIAYDNISNMTNWLSDALCRISTGGSFSTRKLFTDTEETILSVKKPIIINGINQVIDRQDLLDRSIVICLEAMPSDKRTPEHELQKLDKEILPGILALLLDTASKCLLNMQNITINNSPRMADFVHWVSAGIHTLGVSKEQFIDSYTQNRLVAIDECISSDIVASAIMVLMKTEKEWQGTATELKLILKEQLDPNEWDLKDIPKSPASLGHHLVRLMTFLKSKGIQINRSRTEKSRKITIARLG